MLSEACAGWDCDLFQDVLGSAAPPHAYEKPGLVWGLMMRGHNHLARPQGVGAGAGACVQHSWTADDGTMVVVEDVGAGVACKMQHLAEAVAVGNTVVVDPGLKMGCDGRGVAG